MERGDFFVVGDRFGLADWGGHEAQAVEMGVAGVGGGRIVNPQKLGIGVGGVANSARGAWTDRFCQLN